MDGETPESTAELEARRRRELRKASKQKEAAQNLVVYLDSCNVDALVNVARNSLEALKNRISMNADISSGNFRSSQQVKKTEKQRCCLTLSFYFNMLTVDRCI